MPPRFAYWTIIFDGQPTAFRSATRDELLPTFKRLQAKHPDAQLRYFARGKLWYSEEEARADLIRARRPRGDRPPFRSRPDGDRPRWQDRPDRDTRGPRPEWKDRPARDSRGPQPEWKDRPPRDSRGAGPDWKKPRGPRPEEKDRPKDRWRSRPHGTPPGKPTGGGDRRGRDWRPGGDHADPRDRFKVPRDVKRARFKEKARRDRMHPKPPKKKDEK